MATDTSTNPTPQEGTQTDFLSAIQDKLISQSGIISSTNSELQNRLNSAISGVKTSAEKSNQALESKFGRELEYVKEDANNQITSGRAAGQGGVLNLAALRELTSTTDKSLKDLEQRKQELILANDAQAASQISALQMQALDFQQKAQQQVFTNLLGMANYGLQQKQSELSQRVQTFQESSAVSEVALKYGLDIKPGETLSSITTRAMPFASKAQQLELKKMESEINAANAQAAKYMADAKSAGASSKGLDSMSASVLASNFLRSDSAMQAYILNNIKTAPDMAKFQSALSEAKNAKMKEIDAAIPALAGVKDIDAALAASNNVYSPSEVADIKTRVKAYQIENEPKSAGHSLAKDVGSLLKGGYNLSVGLSNYLLGQGSFQKIK